MKKSFIRVATLGLTTSTLAFVSQAMAQGVPADETDGDIIVTATRDARSLQDVPMSVVAVKGDDIQKLSILNARDIQQLAPGLDIAGRTTSMRGVSFHPNSGTSAAVQLYVNEVPSDAYFVYNALYDIGQIEVLRGAQGLLRGVSSPGGAITYTTRRPDFDSINGYVQATGAGHAYNVQGGVSLPFSDTFAIRVAAVVDGNRGNKIYNVNRGEWSKSRNESARVTLGWRPSDNFTAYLTYTYLQTDSLTHGQVFGPGAAPVAQNPARSGPAATIEDRIAVQDGVSRTFNRIHVLNLNADLDLGWGTLSFVGARQDTINTDITDNDSFNAVPGYVGRTENVVPRMEYSGEVRLNSNRDSTFSWGVGAFYRSLRGNVTYDQNQDSFFGQPSLPPGFFPVLAKLVVPLKDDLFSANVNARLALGKLTIEGGLRYSIYRKTQSSLIQVISPLVPLAPPSDLVPANLANSRDTPITGGINATFEASPELTVYAAYNRAFRPRSAGVGAPAGVSNDLIKTDVETSQSFEAGIKASLFDRRLNVSLVGFYQKFDGYIDLFGAIRYNCRDVSGVCNPAGPPIDNVNDNPLTNGAFNFNYNGDAVSKGFEVQIDARPTDNWDISFNAAYSKARYANAALPCNDYNGDGVPDAIGTPRITGTGNVSYCRSNGRIGNTPDFSATATTELRFPTGSVTPFFRGLIAYNAGYYSDRSAFQYPSRTLVNLYLGIRGPDNRWEAFGMVRNLLNQQRITAISLSEGVVTSRGGASYLSGYRSVTTTPPREFSASVLFRF